MKYWFAWHGCWIPAWTARLRHYSKSSSEARLTAAQQRRKLLLGQLERFADTFTIGRRIQHGARRLFLPTQDCHALFQAGLQFCKYDSSLSVLIDMLGKPGENIPIQGRNFDIHR